VNVKTSNRPTYAAYAPIAYTYNFVIRLCSTIKWAIERYFSLKQPHLLVHALLMVSAHRGRSPDSASIAATNGWAILHFLISIFAFLTQSSLPSERIQSSYCRIQRHLVIYLSQLTKSQCPTKNAREKTQTKTTH